MIDNEFEDSETLCSESTTSKNEAQHPTIGDAPHVVTEAEMGTITESVQFISNAFRGFTKLFCDDDGMLVDLSDKAGRNRDREFMLNLQAKIDASVERIEQSLQQHYKAEFHPEDKQVLETLNKNFHDTRYWVFGSCFFGALFFFMGIVACISSNNKVSELEQRYDEQTEIADFGKYVKERAPQVYRGWKERLTAKQDSAKSGTR